MSRTLVSTRVVEQVVLVVPLAVVPLLKRGELGDDRSAFEAVVGTISRGRRVSKDIELAKKARWDDLLFLLDFGGDFLGDLFLLWCGVEQGRSVF